MITVAQLIRRMDTPFVVGTMTEFHDNPTGFLESIYTLIDEHSPSMKEFMRVIDGLLGMEAMIGAAATLAFLHRRAELEETTRTWLFKGLFSRPDRFFENHALALVTAVNDFQKRAQQTIDRDTMGFKGFLMGASESYGIRFATGATTMIELLLRSEDLDRSSLN